MNNRNKKCECGSGRKYKNCCLNKATHKRFNLITYQPSEEDINRETNTINVSIHIDATNEKIDLLVSETKKSLLSEGTKLQTGYFRKSGKPKILSEIPSNGEHYTDIIKQIKKFDKIYAIDTNNRILSNGIKSVGIAFEIYGIPTNNGYEFHHIPVDYPFLITEETNKPENYNWRKLIELIEKVKKYSKDIEIAIIVDSDLGSIPDYNSRKEPIIDDYYLPKNYQLIFASDSASHSFLNTAIKKCHKFANKVIGLIEENLKQSAKKASS
jgi:hypothetical protein